MLVIITYLLCVYLIYKGFEIYMIALVNNRPENKGAMLLGGILLILSFLLAIAFAGWITAVAGDMSDRIPRIP